MNCFSHTFQKEAVLTSGRVFRVWINDGTDIGDTADDGGSDIPGQASSPDHADFFVNGRRDLLDFFPVMVRIDPAAHSALSPSYYRLRQRHGAVSFVCTSLGNLNAGWYLTRDIYNCGYDLDDDLLDATVTPIPSGGIALPSAFVQWTRLAGGRGVLLVEGAANSAAPLVLEAVAANGRVLLSSRLPLRVAPVEEMYTRVNLRGTNTVSTAGSDQPPWSGRNILFLHGFNVTEQDARGWHAEMFKRLWRSGSNARFHAVTWRGDIGWPTGIYYHDDVASAFGAAPLLAEYTATLPGSLVVMAHSLGNILASSAIADHEMTVEKLLMLNAALPAEAYDGGRWNDSAAYNPMLHEDWLLYPPSSWSAAWHKNFFFMGHPNDDRGRLTWIYRFASVPSLAQVYNYYSSGDEVLSLFTKPDPGGSGAITVNSGTGAELRNHAWQKQERFKGRFMVDWWGGNAGTSQAGWGFSDPPLMRVVSGIGDYGVILYSYVNNPATNRADMLSYLRGNPVLPFDFYECNVLFRGNPAAMRQPSIPPETRGEILARGIPAMSGPAGSDEVEALNTQLEGRNSDMNDGKFRNGWPRWHADYDDNWLHSDMKSVAYWYTSKLFDSIVTNGELK